MLPDIYRETLARYWGFTSFRPMQEEIIESVVSGSDVVGLLPTGGGKSVTYQLPPVAGEGLCLVITPLIALMKDQVVRLKTMNIKAMAIHSGMTREEVEISLDNCLYGDYRLLYVSPERLQTPMFRARLPRFNFTLVAVDEAHCISQWGYDFRPSYLHIAEIRDMMNEDVPFLALTATATPRVVDDIISRLKMKNPKVHRTSFRRPNITYMVREVEDKNTYVLRSLKKEQGSGIIYVSSRKRAKEVAEMLVANNIKADFYHAGLPQEMRDRKQTSWSAGETRVIVATNAFGMGIDKADVRFVIHWDCPDSVEAYYQESGRAGRDGKPSFSVLLWSQDEKRKLADSVRIKFPPVERIKDVYEAIGNFYQLPVGSGRNSVHDFDLWKFVSAFRFSVTETYNSLNFLQKEGYLEFTDEINNPSRVHFVVTRDDLYKFQVANEEYDRFIKLLLRTYSGMFSEFVPVNEENLAARSGLTREAIYQYLLRLSSQGIIHFIPGKKSPLVIFTEERLDRSHLRISPELYLKVKENYIERVARITDYAENKTRCRPAFLAAYFGEESGRCGLCDTCQERNELELSKYEFDLIIDKIKELLAEKPLRPEELEEQIDLPREKSIKVIRWLLDHEKLVYDSDHRLTWKR
ncbi:MAG: RecQ family ATP-dependent DNA helicase [Bacteroidales bacterium]|jgi:ATP-dependent DNA helicase RecQ|nr:RecQ family ATP-dependent DNA helicase [Bacteroidales bacterium]MDX9926202.1 RecQ family ATP-dependent DNA helicase [Bacteroidales bacterium]HNX84268.1 RecQ family ATP-dependent DNA helicase [Bacteroidales bacterium]HPS98116.1 RecQ family ATP-dependent DNA helicase [Bacteroidales bacterium]